MISISALTVPTPVDFQGIWKPSLVLSPCHVLVPLSLNTAGPSSVAVALSPWLGLPRALIQRRLIVPSDVPSPWTVGEPNFSGDAFTAWLAYFLASSTTSGCSCCMAAVALAARSRAGRSSSEFGSWLGSSAYAEASKLSRLSSDMAARDWVVLTDS